ncbi:hypothetical protein CAPTEDRAFT_208959 [Capitella teleta]|uniref:Uncharacterized protein n=1 Tax=Capitella teleta TaxID=283909 RepID=R7U382_CAPTE|nr:hypothetical protein CAPTEDRAFT_208959 [Capitella teleta]|eukprot:ELT97640.1 hypothetical protein CAPTEDRAFT_208959 [Capitella teleta]
MAGKVIGCNPSTIEHGCACANEWWEPALEECTSCDEICAYDAPICRQYCNVFAADKFDPVTDLCQESLPVWVIGLVVALFVVMVIINIGLLICIYRDKHRVRYGATETVPPHNESTGKEGSSRRSSTRISAQGDSLDE